MTIEFRGDHYYLATTASGGKYSIRLPSGKYTVDLNVKTTLLEGPATITVERGHDLNVDFVVQAPYQ